jgi:hypothetical protein
MNLNQLNELITEIQELSYPVVIREIELKVNEDVFFNLTKELNNLFNVKGRLAFTTSRKKEKDSADTEQYTFSKVTPYGTLTCNIIRE